MQSVSSTRMELFARKSQIALAKQGRDLLEQKRTALMKEFMRIADTVMEHSGLPSSRLLPPPARRLPTPPKR